jgi:PKD repeat protein
MNMRMRGLCSAALLALATMAAAQCPGVRPKFSWASNGSSIVFMDQTDAYVTDRVWEFGDGESDTGLVDTEHAYDFAGDDTVTLTVTVGGCPFSVSGRLVHPGVNDACYSQITSAFTTEQTGNNLMQFTDASQGDGSFLFYLWTFGDDSISIDSSASHFYALPGAYNVSHSIGTVDSLFQTACVAGSAQRVFVDGNTSTCDSSLFLDLSLQPTGNTVTCIAQAVLFSADLVITQWQWDYGDGSYETTMAPTAEHEYPNGGDIQVCVQVWTQDTTNDSTCFARTCISLSLASLVGMDDVANRQMLRARPVPFSEELWIEGEAVRSGERWRLLDVLGREAGTGTFSHNEVEHVVFATLPTGIYTLVVPFDRGFRSLRLLKQ